MTPTSDRRTIGRLARLGCVAVLAFVAAACTNDDTTPAAGSGSSPDAAVETDTSEPDLVPTPTATADVSEDAGADGAVPGSITYDVDVSRCDDPAEAQRPIEGPIRIGTSLPLSGGPAVLFAPYADGQRAYVEYYNSTFGGIDGRPIELIVTDDQYSPEQTLANSLDLVVDEQVDVVAGGWGTANIAAAQERLNALCVPHLWAASGAPQWGNVDEFPWTTGLLVPYAIEAQAWGEFVSAELGNGTTSALLYVDNGFGRAYASAYRATAAALGIEIVAEETIDPAASSAPTDQVARIVAADPDSILAAPLGAQCIAFMAELGNQQAANAGFDPLVYQTATCAYPIFFGAVPNEGAIGVFTSSNLKDVNNPDNSGDPAVAAYLEAFAATESLADPGGNASIGWLAMELTVHAVQAASDSGDLSRAGIIDAARNIDYSPGLLLDGLTFKMNATDGFIAEGTGIRQWNGSGFDTVGSTIDAEGSLGTFTGS